MPTLAQMIDDLIQAGWTINISDVTGIRMAWLRLTAA